MVSLGPREDFGRLQRSPALRPVDAEPVWSIVCFFVERGSRRKGVAAALLDAAVGHAKAHGARLVEGYPVAPGAECLADTEVYTGLVSMFREAGFEEVAHRRGRRVIMRRA